MHYLSPLSLLSYIYTLYLPDNSHDPRLEMCRSTCDDRLQSAALDSTLSSSILPSSLNTLFLTQGVGYQSSTFKSTSNNNQQSSVTSRPRRLPHLIKILTGFDDEPYWNVQSSDSSPDSNSRPIIARIDIPRFVQPSQPSGSEPVKDTVQLAAAAAATAVWSKSIRIFGNHRMQRVNSEWDAALRWIAGWDQKQHQMEIGEGMSSEPRTKVDEHNTSLGGGATGFNTFLDDLAKMLKSCMKQCLEDEDFDTRLGNSDEGSSGEIAMRKSLIGIGDMALRSFFGWITSLSFSRHYLEQLISAESRFILGRTVQLVASSMGVYAIHSIWVWASPALLAWYSSLGYTESPEWLLEHEKEIQVAKKTSRARQKKKSKRRQMRKQAGKSRSKQQTPSKVEMQKESRETASSKDYLDPNHLVKNNESPPEPEKSMPKAEEQASNIITSKDSPSLISEISVPSLISYPTITSASSSPSCKPNSHLEDEGVPYDDSLLPESYHHSTLGLTSSQEVGSSHGPVFPKLSHQNGLPVPTQAQRDQAAQQLREFQNVQIQRLLLKKKLAQSCVATSSTAQRSGLQPDLSSFTQDGNSFNIFSVNQSSKKVFKPPPGLSHPSAESQYVLPTQGGANGFLTDNELFLSKLLDDEEDEGGGVKKPTLSALQIQVPSMSPEPESSLDPAAAPFVGQLVVSEESSKRKSEKGDVWQSDSGEISLREGSSSKMIKGAFYGGSVW